MFETSLEGKGLAPDGNLPPPFLILDFVAMLTCF